MSGYKRPRVSYELAEQVESTAERLNGAPVAGFEDAVRLLARYHDVLTGNVGPCPNCGHGLDRQSGDASDPATWTWRCISCYYPVEALDYVDPDEPDAATLPLSSRLAASNTTSRHSGGSVDQEEFSTRSRRL